MNQTTLIEFPCHFPVKIIGVNSSSFLSDIKDIVLKHFPNDEQVSLTQNPSKNSNFLAITATVYVKTQKMLDDFYRDLSKHPDVKMVL